MQLPNLDFNCLCNHCLLSPAFTMKASVKLIIVAHDYLWLHETLKNKVKSLLTWVQVCLTLFFIHLFYGRLANNMWAAPTRNWHNLQWPVKQRRTQHFSPQSQANWTQLSIFNARRKTSRRLTKWR